MLRDLARSSLGGLRAAIRPMASAAALTPFAPAGLAGAARTLTMGVPKEIKKNENRVGMTPAKVSELTRRGHKVLVESNAGAGSGFEDEDFAAMGATIVPTCVDVYQQADMIVKVKEPLAPEYTLIREGQVVFTYFHFASSKELTEAMIQNKSICISYETVAKSDGSLPLLIPMSEIAGRMSVQQGAKYLEAPMGGRGVLLGGVPGVRRGFVLVLGGGIVGTHAAKLAAGLGAEVTIMDLNLQRLRYLNDIMPANVETRYSNESTIRDLLRLADLVIGAVLIPGARAPKLVTREMLSIMRPGSVVIDVAVDQGGCIETCKATTHDEPTYVVDNVLHYCVANMPGAVPYTSTIALTNATLPYTIALAEKGWRRACADNAELKGGLNIIEGKVVHEGVASAFDLPYEPVENFIASHRH
ncbi:unnamed protein product [Vitrella brassicaformis CCMP3155]|uniref:alanine dehydrogenase n=1 Tax=Vitrella brassicaformis (strain CCMP3155) TaxID=1169540 RepID=A0A0G4EE22_VITBC|nr:unnamed protein product [Vitrella brassicaformis CCMP3155]|mmetsp:Transcript_5769/g.13790  ORF Transcript_5769/g.13790 Transcript_5769/m.13790 type:complete len:416 (-) Transcript_5769:195-1442(-)|eukprot:CEL94227.1 unnamed protein product [Vitrella brassicaformis CCMP3155]